MAASWDYMLSMCSNPLLAWWDATGGIAAPDRRTSHICGSTVKSRSPPDPFSGRKEKERERERGKKTTQNLQVEKERNKKIIYIVLPQQTECPLKMVRTILWRNNPMEIVLVCFSFFLLVFWFSYSTIIRQSFSKIL